MTITIAVANQKGGVGKTTTVLSLAHGMAMAGKRVLVIDLDPQGQSATFLGMPPEMGVFYLLMTGVSSIPSGNELTMLKQRVRQSGRTNLWILPGGKETAAAQNVLSALEKPVSYVRDVIRPFAQNGLDYILLDTPPSLGGLQERAIWAANFVIAPFKPESGSLEGLVNLVDTLKTLKEKSWKGTLLGLLPTFYEERTRESRITMNDLRKGRFAHLSGFLLPPISEATVLREAVGEGLTIFEKDPNCPVAQQYQKLVDYVMKF